MVAGIKPCQRDSQIKPKAKIRQVLGSTSVAQVFGTQPAFKDGKAQLLVVSAKARVQPL
ncbi:unannotated protein [freshwater metagenome]|uniref:Unannotated protein n=1 Tax=freshwater metagenome TaxID=449393 RepID=A0A6J6ETT5_9ZZZZ